MIFWMRSVLPHSTIMSESFCTMSSGTPIGATMPIQPRTRNA